MRFDVEMLVDTVQFGGCLHHVLDQLPARNPRQPLGVSPPWNALHSGLTPRRSPVRYRRNARVTRLSPL